MPEQPRPIVYRDGDRPPAVNKAHPLVGLEQRVLIRWLESSPRLKAAYLQNPRNQHDLETAARAAVHEAFARELELRSQGMTLEQAMEQTRPAMWTPPSWHPKATRPRAATSRPRVSAREPKI